MRLTFASKNDQVSMSSVENWKRDESKEEEQEGSNQYSVIVKVGSRAQLSASKEVNLPL